MSTENLELTSVLCSFRLAFLFLFLFFRSLLCECVCVSARYTFGMSASVVHNILTLFILRFSASLMTLYAVVLFAIIVIINNFSVLLSLLLSFSLALSLCVSCSIVCGIFDRSVPRFSSFALVLSLLLPCFFFYTLGFWLLCLCLWLLSLIFLSLFLRGDGQCYFVNLFDDCACCLRLLKRQY